MSYRDVDDGRLRDLALRDPELRTDTAPVDMSLAHELEARAGHWLDTAGPTYGDPYPVSDYLFLVSYAGPGPGQFNLYLLDLCGNQVPFYSDPAMGSHGPLLVRPSSVFTTCPTTLNAGGDASPETSWGKVLVTDVYRGLPDIERGRARYIQIMEQVPKTHEWARRAYDQSPVMGYGTYYAKRCWGRVDIAADGSAYFELPALREVYLQVLDAEGRELQRSVVDPGDARRAARLYWMPRAAPTTPPTSSPSADGRPAAAHAPHCPCPGPAMDGSILLPSFSRYSIDTARVAIADRIRTAAATSRATRPGCSTWPTIICSAAVGRTASTI